MSRTLRGVGSRRGPLSTLFLMTVVVVAGTVTVVGFADQAGTSRLLAAPLLLLGIVAVPSTGRELGSVRRGEIGLARLHGLQGADLVRFLAAEPLIVLLAGAVVGFPLGVLGSWSAGRAWLSHPSAPVGEAGVVAVLAIVVAGLVAVLAGMTTAVREPLARQVGTVERPSTATVVGLFGSLLVLVAAVVAVYRSRTAGSADPDWVVLAGPALVGLAAGQIAVWLVQLAAAAAMRRTARGSLPAFLAVRRLGRAAARVTPIRLLVAAATLAAVALTGATAVDTWTDHTARIRNGAPLRIPLDTGAAGALAVTQQLDPEGRWLMAAVVVPEDSDTVERRAFVDTSRYDAVVGDFLDGTPAAGVGSSLAELAPGRAPTVGTGDKVGVAARVISGPSAGLLRISFNYVSDQNLRVSSPILLHAVSDGGEAEATLPHCGGGCILTGMSVSQPGLRQPRRILITSLRFGGAELVHQHWSDAISTKAGLDVVVEPGPPVELSARTENDVLPILTTRGVGFLDADKVKSPGGNERRAVVVGELPALPLVDASGALADLPRSLVGADSTVPAAEVMVLARADTPAAVLAGLAEAGAGSPESLATMARSTSDETGAAQARMYSLMALTCLPLALLVLAAAAARQRRLVIHELAALRLLRVPDAEIRMAGRVELGWLVGTVVVAGAAGAAVAVVLLLGQLPLVTPLAHSGPVDTGLAALPLLVVLAVAALSMWWLGARARSAPDRLTRPSALREGSVR